MPPALGTWVAALLTIFALSFLYKDNPLFRFTESLFAGVSLGYYIGVTLNQTLMPNLITPLTHDFNQNWDLLVPGLLGVLLYMRYLPKGGWIARYALAIYVAYYIGLDFTRRIHGEVLPQLARAIVPLSKFDSHTIFYSLVFAIGVFSVLIYFFFSKEQDRVTRRVARLGIYFLMVSFGAAFGFTVMGRVALLIGRLNFLILDWIYPMLGIR
ncbi:MAG TPA: hypothetical protein VN539_00605 [Candidatus Saccharimonadales bacterium]|nr:hypothetical protein [Candidatus Saccharimonadales bacterium]